MKIESDLFSRELRSLLKKNKKKEKKIESNSIDCFSRNLRKKKNSNDFKINLDRK